MRASVIAAAGVIAVVAFVAYRNRQDLGEAFDLGADLGTEPSDGLGDGYGTDYESAGGASWFDSFEETVKQATTTIKTALGGYSPDVVPVAYRGAIAQAESANGIPAGMLARLLWQESRYRPEIIDGRVKSPVGAVGIAQFMPATAAEWGVNPLDPLSSIDGAGRYLGWLYRKLGAWDKALAAYNWGIGNVQRKGLAAAPAETRTYYASILSDVGLA